MVRRVLEELGRLLEDVLLSGSSSGSRLDSAVSSPVQGLVRVAVPRRIGRVRRWRIGSVGADWPVGWTALARRNGHGPRRVSVRSSRRLIG